jgi:hydrogenase/urease accessory protein HupE
MKLLIVTRPFTVLLIGMLCLARWAQAHDPGLSAADLRLEGQQIAAVLTFSRPDIELLAVLDTDRNGQVAPNEFSTLRPALEQVARGALEVRLDGKQISPGKVDVDWDDSNAVHLRLGFPVRSGARLTLRSALMASLPPGHRQYMAVRDERENLLSERMLAANADGLEIDAVPAATSPSFREFLILGVEHILTGYDHLVFLLGLLIAGGSLMAVAKIITSFTVAHSITLAVATLGWINISPRIVEPLIAVSIAYVGLENIFRRDLNRRWLLTFGFGLIHGFGFASVLREMGIGSDGGGVTLPLLSFNLGVELGQLAIASLILPLIWSLRRRTFFVARFAPACSIMIALAGAYWLVLRTL